MIARPAQSRGFTLIELILVLVILSIMIALASPTLRGWGQGQKLRNAADSFVAATGYARSQAVTTATPYAVEINETERSFVVQSIGPDGVRTPAAGDMGKPTKLAETYTIKLVSGGGTGQLAEGQATSGTTSLVFYPDSRGTPAVVEFGTPVGDTIQVASESPAEPFAKVEAVK